MNGAAIVPPITNIPCLISSLYRKPIQMTQANQDVSEPETKSQVRTARARFQKMMAGVLCLLSLGFISAAVMLPGTTAIAENVMQFV